MWKRRSVALLIYTIATLQVIGYGFKAWTEGNSLSNFLLLNTVLSERSCLLVSQGTVVLMALMIFWSFFKWSPWPFFTLGFLFLTEAIFRTVVGGDFASNFAITGHAARYLWLLAVGYALLLRRSLDVQRTLPVIPTLCRVGLSLTFITHGIEALLRDPKLVDMLIATSHSLPIFPANESLAKLTLLFVGIVDVLCGIWALWRPHRSLLYYMGVWGILTALVRIPFSPTHGIFEALIRASHGGLPFLIILLQGARTSPKKGVSAKFDEGQASHSKFQWLGKERSKPELSGGK